MYHKLETYLSRSLFMCIRTYYRLTSQPRYANTCSFSWLTSVLHRTIIDY